MLGSDFLHARSEWRIDATATPQAQEIVQRKNDALPVYGLYCWSDEYLKHRDFIKATGWRHIRLSGPIDDAVMRACAEDGMVVMFTVAARRPMDRGEGKPSRQWRNRADYPDDESFLADYLGDLTAVLERYGPEGTFWNSQSGFRPLQALEIYNEPNFWYLEQTKEEWIADMKNPDEGRRIKREDARAALYAKMLTASYRHIKSRWPSVQVVAFGAGGSGYADVRFIRAVHEMDPSIGKSYDVLSTHPYTHHVPPEAVAIRSWGEYSQARSLAEIREIMARHGAGSKPVWWTELGWGIHHGAGGKFDQANAVGGDKTVAPEMHAAFYVRGYARAIRLGVERLDFMSLVDTDSFNSGMLNPDGTPRLTAVAVATMIRMLPHPQLSAVLSDGGPGTGIDKHEIALGKAVVMQRPAEVGLFLYAIRPDVTKSGAPDVLMAWCATGGQTLELKWPYASAKITEMSGLSEMVPALNGKISVPVSVAPVYLSVPSQPVSNRD